MAAANLADARPRAGLIPMAVDHIRYDLLAQQALRGVVRSVLVDAAKKGLPGDHHFYISFDTRADGVRMSDRLRKQYPEEITIILQHQFWDLIVGEDGFEVGLSFGGVPERISVPFQAIKGFFDPSVQFGLQFEPAPAAQAAPADAEPAATPAKARGEPAAPTMPLPANPPAVAPAPGGDEPEKTPAGGEVVRLDRFRKK
jgi:hypothetical protein